MLIPTQPETGRLMGTLPYVRLGDGPKTLLVVPGIGDAMFDGTYGPIRSRLLERMYQEYLEDYTVYVVSRPRGLEHDTSIEDMATKYIHLLESQLAPASVLGISMGGLIAQEIARERPDLVDRLVLAVSGSRLSSEGLEVGRRTRWYALEREWTTLRSTLLEQMYTGVRNQLYPRLSSTVGRLRPPTPATPQDVIVSIDAVLEYHGTDRLGEIEPRTLVIGGTDDPFFPEEILRETHDGLLDSQLAMFQDARHGAFIERKAGFDNWVLQFLQGEGQRIHQL